MVKTRKCILRISFIICAVFIVLFPVFEFSLSGYRDPFDVQIAPLDVDYKIYADDDLESLTLPFSFFQADKSYRLSFTMPKIVNGESLSLILRAMGVEVFIDGIQIYDYKYPQRFNYPLLRMYHNISLDSSYSNKSVDIFYYPSYPFFHTITAPFLDQSGVISYNIFSPYRYAFILFTILIFSGCISLIISFFVKKSSCKNLLLFAFLDLAVVFSLFFSMLLSQIVVKNPAISFLLSNFFKSLISVLFLSLLRSVFKTVNAFSLRSKLGKLSFLMVLCFPFFLVLALLGVPFSYITLVLDPLLIVFFASVFVILIRRKERRGYIFSSMASLLLVAFSLNFISLLSPYYNSHFDAINIVLASFALFIAIIEAAISFSESNEMIIKVDTLIKKSYFDVLTGLGNFNAFTYFMNDLDGVGRSYYVAFFDLDRLKKINDNLGHESGDVIIKAFSDVMKDNVNEDAKAFRLGGDEFLLLTLEEYNEGSKAEVIANSYFKRTGESVSYSDGTFIIRSKEDMKEVLHDLDVEMLEKKRKRDEK